jgi:hypothetical protein
MEMQLHILTAAPTPKITQPPQWPTMISMVGLNSVKQIFVFSVPHPDQLWRTSSSPHWRVKWPWWMHGHASPFPHTSSWNGAKSTKGILPLPDLWWALSFMLWLLYYRAFAKHHIQGSRFILLLWSVTHFQNWSYRNIKLILVDAIWEAVTGYINHQPPKGIYIYIHIYVALHH